jgi:DtxR family Mn-dependent transcriptional regulator
MNFSLWWILVVVSVGAVVGWPRRGLWARWREGRRLAARARQEDALKHILKCESNAQDATVLSVAGALGLRDFAAAALLRELESHGLVSFEEGRLRLLPAGRKLGVQVVRAHRLWESFLAEETGVAEARWHRLADRQEHLLTPQQTEALAARLGHPLHDPHGDRIPDTEDSLPADAGQSVNTVAVGRPFTIVHIEDEPEAVYAGLLREGLRPGMRAYVLSRDAEKLRLWADGREHELAPSTAQQLSVEAIADLTPERLREERLLPELPPGGARAGAGPDRRLPGRRAPPAARSRFRFRLRGCPPAGQSGRGPGRLPRAWRPGGPASRAGAVCPGGADPRESGRMKPAADTTPAAGPAPAAAGEACASCSVYRAAHLRKLGLGVGRWDFVVALAGNPNTGKSTVFNALTGLRQHTGNWPGKTVTRAEGGFEYHGVSDTNWSTCRAPTRCSRPVPMRRWPATSCSSAGRT